jgi:hypothetical protein
MELSGNEERFLLAEAEWGKLPDGHVVGKPVPLFPRIEVVASGKRTRLTCRRWRLAVAKFSQRDVTSEIV